MLRRQRALLRARGAGAAPAEAAGAPVDLAAVDRERDLHGIVVRESNGAPIAGAELRVVAYPWRRANVLNHDGYDDTLDGPGTRSAIDGTFALRLRAGTEVALRVCAAGHAPLELRELQAGARVTNPASRRILEKCGFQWTGVGLCRIRAISSSAPIDQFRLDRGLWTSLKSWGAVKRVA